MSDEIRMEGLGVAPGVLDTIVTVATQSVEGVSCVGAPGLAGLVQKGVRKGAARAVDVSTSEDGRVQVSVHIHADYGAKLRSVAEQIQLAVSDALVSQVGVEVESVDVFVDGVVFPE